MKEHFIHETPTGGGSQGGGGQEKELPYEQRLFITFNETVRKMGGKNDVAERLLEMRSFMGFGRDGELMLVIIPKKGDLVPKKGELVTLEFWLGDGSVNLGKVTEESEEGKELHLENVAHILALSEGVVFVAESGDALLLSKNGAIRETNIFSPSVPGGGGGHSG